MPDFSSRQPAMDATSALGTAACILSATQFITDLLSTSQTSTVQPPQGCRDEQTISETLQKFITALSEIQIPSVLQQPPLNAINPSSNAAALRELAYLRDSATAVLRDIAVMLRQVPNEKRLHVRDTDTRALLRSRLVGTPCVEKLDQISWAVTKQVDSILR